MTDPISIRPDSSGDDGDLLVIARLRSALDEVAAGVEHSSLPLVHTGTDRRDVSTGELVIGRAAMASPPSSEGPRSGNDARRTRPIAWLAVAAACTALVGSAAWALAQRQPIAPAAAPGATLPPSSFGASGDPSTDPARPSAAAPIGSLVSVPSTISAGDEPWFTLASANLAPGRITRPARVEPSTEVMFQSWRITDGADVGFLFARISTPDDVRNVPDTADRAEEISTISSGRAWLLAPADATSDVGAQVFWARDDGAVWLFDSQGLSTDSLLRLVSGAEVGSGVPIVLTSLPPSGAGMVSLIAIGTAPSAVTGQDYLGTAGGSVDLTVTDGGAAPMALVRAVTVDVVSVAGSTGWMGSYADGHVEVVWDAGQGWWGVLVITADLADNADGIVAAVMAGDAATLAPRPPMLATNATYRVIAVVSDDPNGIVAIVPEDSAYQARVGLTGFSWSDVTDERLVDGARRGGPYQMIVRWDGYSFDLVEVIGAAEGSSAAATCPVDVVELDHVMDELPALDSLALGIVSYGYDTADGDCSRLQLHAYLDTPELDLALAPYVDRLTIDYVLTPLAA